METLLVMTCGCKLTRDQTKRFRKDGDHGYKRKCREHGGIAISKICFCVDCGKSIKKDLAGKDILRCKKCKKEKQYLDRKKYEMKCKRPARTIISKNKNNRGCYCKEKCKSDICSKCNKYVPLFANYDPAKMTAAKR